MLAGGLGGTSGDMLMHSLDTVKTRQQGDPHFPPKYTSLGSSYYKILRQEGIRRGLYGGWLPALLGSFPGTVIFFGTYEYCKRHMLDYSIQPHVAYLSAGALLSAVGSLGLLLTCCRFCRRPCRICRVRAVGSTEDAAAAPGPIPKPILPLGLQL